MKAIIYRGSGGPDVLQLVDRDLPVPGPGEVRVRVAVSGVNPTDWQARSSARPGQFPEIVPHLDGAGVIDAVGESVDGGRVGQRVGVHGRRRAANRHRRRVHRSARRPGRAAARRGRLRRRPLARRPRAHRAPRLNVVQNMVLNTRFQFLVLYTAGPQARAAAVEDVAAAVRDGALPVGEEHGLPLVRFPLDHTADAHRAVEAGTVGKILVDVTS